VDKTFSVPSFGESYVGFVVEGEDVVIDSLSFNIESDFETSSRRPLSIDFFEGEKWEYEEFSNELLNKDWGCYDEVLGSEGPSIGNILYCEMITLPDTGVIKVGAEIRGSDTKNLSMRVYTESGTGGESLCKYNPNSADGCMIYADIDDKFFPAGNYQVCVSADNFTNYKASVFLNSVFKNLYNFRAGFEYEYFRFKQKIAVDTLFDEFQKFSSYGTVFASLNADTRNRSLFPTKGFTSEIRFEYIMPLSKNVIKDLFTNSGIAYMKYEHYLKLSAKFVLNPGYFVGITMKQDEVVPVQHLFAAGGLNPNNYIATCVDFTGLHFIQTYGYYMGIARMKLRYNFMKKMYLTLRTDAGANVFEFEDMYDLKNLAFGYGITGSYDSFIGPIQLSVMGSNINSGLMLFLNLGFWF